MTDQQTERLGEMERQAQQLVSGWGSCPAARRLMAEHVIIFVRAQLAAKTAEAEAYKVMCAETYQIVFRFPRKMFNPYTIYQDAETGQWHEGRGYQTLERYESALEAYADLKAAAALKGDDA